MYRFMLRIIYVLFVCSVVTCPGRAAVAQYLFKDASGHEINFAHYKGRWIIINYWAVWCGSCWAEVPELNAFYQAHKKQVALFAVNYDHPPARTAVFYARKLSIQFPILIDDPRELFHIGEITALPTTILIDPDGKVRQVLVGEQTKKDLERAIGLL